MGIYSLVAVLLLSAINSSEGINVVVLVGQGGGDGAGYLPLAGALSSVTRLAAEHVVDEAATTAASEINFTVSAAVVEVGIGAVADLCLALDQDNDTVAVREGFQLTYIAVL